MASTARTRTRVVLHIDLDAFYCQVEMKRVGIPAHVPCAVQQWEGLIAVNYPARAAGITRHMRRAEAKAKCPELQCVHVETIGGDAGAGNDSAVTWEDRKTQKACLERYRVASAEIIAVFHEVAPDAIVEKASIDEAYLDVTTIVEAHLQASDGGPTELTSTSQVQLPALDSADCGNHVIGGALDLGSEFERRLAVGGQLACQLRAAVRSKLGFTCSAGVACNKLMAKIASAMHKPNQQTVVPPRAVPNLMKDMPLKKIRNFGGKLGAELQSLGCTTAGEVLALPAATLHQHFGERATWILYTVNGNSDEQVQVKERPKSMLAAKSFEPISDMAAVERWVTILAEELADRMVADNKLFNRRPKSLHLHYRPGTTVLSQLWPFRGGGGGGWGNGDRSKSCPMPRFLKAGPTAPVICETVMRLFQKCPDAMPCTRLAVAASDFEDGPLSEGQGSITKFFGAGSGSNTVKGEASLPSRSGQALSTPSKTVGGPRSKQAAVASMFKAAKMSSGSNTTVATAAAPIIAVAASSAAQPQASSEDCAETGRANAAAHRETQTSGNRHGAAASDSTVAAAAAAQTDTSRWHDASCQLSSAAVEGRLEGPNGGQTDCITTDTAAAAAAELAGAAGNDAGGSGAPSISHEPCSSDAQAAEGNSLSDVDLAEQKRIMHELWLERNALSARIAAKRIAPASKTGSKRSRLSTLGKGKQTQLSAMLTKAPPP